VPRPVIVTREVGADFTDGNPDGVMRTFVA
jgi:hypothetical protein